jgi:hypothetical protein
LQFDAIASNERQVLGEFCLQRDAIPQQFAPRHLDDLKDRFVDVQPVTSWRHILDQAAYAADDITGSVAVFNYSIEGLPDLLQIGGWPPSQRKAA